MSASPVLRQGLRLASTLLQLMAMPAAYAQTAEPSQGEAHTSTVVVTGKRGTEAVDPRVSAAKMRMRSKLSNRSGGMPFYLPPAPGMHAPILPAANIRGARGRILSNDQSLAEAFKAYDSRDYVRAAQLFKEAYEKIGYDEAALMLGRIYLYGLGTKPDSRQAVHWLEEVADGYFTPGIDEQRFDPKAPMVLIPLTEASFTLARMYETGFGVDKDPAKAKRWYRKTADYGYVPALSILGHAALAGSAGQRDPAEALGYFKEAAGLGYVPAMYNAGKLYYKGDDGVPQDRALAAAYFEAAAKRGQADAMLKVGAMAAQGEGGAPDPVAAYVWFSLASAAGNADAPGALMALDSALSPQQRDKALALLAPAATPKK